MGTRLAPEAAALMLEALRGAAVAIRYFAGPRPATPRGVLLGTTLLAEAPITGINPVNGNTLTAAHGPATVAPPGGPPSFYQAVTAGGLVLWDGTVGALDTGADAEFPLPDGATELVFNAGDVVSADAITFELADPAGP